MLCAAGAGRAQKYAAAAIPDSLQKEANAVVREEELRVIIKSPDKAVVRHSYAITVLNEAGNGFARYYGHYDKESPINDISGFLYDASGKELKRVKQKEITDAPYDDNMSFVLDTRVKRHDFNYRQYPYTVYYEEESELSSLFFLPSWKPVYTDNFSVENSRLVVEAPAGYALRYKQLNYGQPDITRTGTQAVYTWQVRNIRPVTWEPYQPQMEEITPTVYLAPSVFSRAGYNGAMDSWLHLGQFIASLNKGRDVLPDNIKQEVHRIADALPDKKARISALYAYMQKNTRYIGIQLGIGGFQPFEASYVANKKYGDCKALSNYMYSLLKEAGISSNYVLINSGRELRSLWEDFPAPYFNHAVLCVPDGRDTVWLECTSQTANPGFVGSGTANKKALLIGDDGGHIVSTRFYQPEDNRQLRKVTATLDEKGLLSARSVTRFTGTQQEEAHSLIHYANSEQREKYLNSELNLPTYTVVKNDYSEITGYNPSVDEILEITSQGYGTITGKRLFFQPNLFNKSGVQLDKSKARRYDIVYRSSFLDADTIQLAIPEGYAPESLPKDVSIQSQFGRYSITYKVNNHHVEVLRVYERLAGRFPATDFEAFARFNEEVYKADRSRMVFVKKEQG